jgi:hypothetical protein
MCFDDLIDIIVAVRRGNDTKMDSWNEHSVVTQIKLEITQCFQVLIQGLSWPGDWWMLDMGLKKGTDACHRPWQIFYLGKGIELRPNSIPLGIQFFVEAGISFPAASVIGLPL